MAISLITSPQYPTTRKKTNVTFSASGGGNYVRVWVTDAPPGSTFKTQLDEAGATRLQVFDGDVSGTWYFAPDAGGVYTFATQEYTKGASGYGGRYEGDPEGYGSETKIGTESTRTINVGERLTMPVGTSGHRATLVLWVWDDTIRATTYELHGEVSPALIDSTTPRAETATIASAVKTALTALVDMSANTALGTPSSILANIRTKLNAHIGSGAFHSNADSDNTVAASFANASSIDGAAKMVSELSSKLDRHQRNDSGSGTGSAGSPYHNSSGADLTHSRLISSASEVADTIAAIADVWRVYEAHRADATVHTSADGTNTLTALPKLLDLHRAFLVEIASTSPTAPAAANPGVTLLVHGAGMTKG